MLITATTFAAIAGNHVNDNMVSALRGLQYAGVVAGLQRPHRLAMFLAQTALESGGWKWDREIWGPTPAQKRYEGRKDLGNTKPGDGAKFRGYTPMQITGRHNTTKFYNWAKTNIDKNCPNFVDNPALMNTDPWEGIGPIWYWSHGKSRSLNFYADQGDFKAVTKQINGGYNHLHERYQYYGKAALMLLGRSVFELREFQRDHGLKVDGVVGPQTAQVLHKELVKLPDVKFNKNETRKTERTGIIDFILSFFRLFIGK